VEGATIIDLLKRLHLPTELLPGPWTQELGHAMRRTRMARGGTLNIVVPVRIGEVDYIADLDEMAALNALLGRERVLN
jgi:3-dehydroquinate synthetase